MRVVKHWHKAAQSGSRCPISRNQVGRGTDQSDLVEGVPAMAGFLD